jgi:hypothetical protein
MIIEKTQVCWHVRNRKEYKAIQKRFAEYSIPHSLSLPRSLIPKHLALMVNCRHAQKASEVLLRFFGRRSGVDIL